MKVKKVYVLLCTICILMPLISCVKDVDFDQAENVVLTPVYEVDFVYSRFDTSQFIDSNIDPVIVIPEVIVNDTLDYDLLGTDFVVDNLERVELTFEFTNTIERDFEFDLGFLNDNNQRIGPLYSMTANSGNGEGTDPIVTREVIILNTADIDVLRDATRLISSMRVQNINSSLRGILELRSKGTYFFNYEL
ncbi:hypothetical protein IWQ47_002560 [Aquimarina sp. EL_43]|uniref:hypothetical protein n=1 Tax=unclassified Aquimarina TaxID=2627091 RepID=UPI0018CACCE9|nr:MULTISPECIES: hypothetical protein [unclassified Aquimarina]MBG6131090.1 hypothetical protein [Aquimarina sp. EL_35]MBG6151549.1 hypothetical protein [Aquimarina sp. EL_32]MBG6169480.1 hypothetical protein [Aquimarina sp. EL_43]